MKAGELDGRRERIKKKSDSFFGGPYISIAFWPAKIESHGRFEPGVLARG